MRAGMNWGKEEEGKGEDEGGDRVGEGVRWSWSGGID